MGWFLRRDKKTKGRKSTRKTAATRREWDPGRTMAGLRALGLLSLVVACAVGWHYGEGLLRDQAARIADRRSQVEVDLVDAPKWMSQLLRTDLSNLAKSQLSTDPMNASELNRVHEKLAANAWVEQVTRIERTDGGSVNIWAQYRQPVALIESRDGFHLVDEQGIQLPGLYLSHQAGALALPIVEGVLSQPKREGLQWPGEDVQAGLSLVMLIRNEAYIDQIRSIDVSRRDDLGRMRLVMHTINGGMVRWGLPPGSEHPIEPDMRTKLTRLASVYRQRGSIDAGGKVVDVFGAAVFVRRLESVQQAEGARQPNSRAGLQARFSRND